MTNDFNLREALDHEYARGLKDGHSSGLLEAAAKEQNRTKTLLKKDMDKRRQALEEAAQPLLDLFNLWFE